MSRREPTFIGQVQSVTGAVVGVELRDDLTSSLMLINGVSYRVGQIGAFLRIPLGYNQLYGVCTQVGAAATPPNVSTEGEPASRWISLVLFGEALGSKFERGVSQYPTVGDEVHLVTEADLNVIYSASETTTSIVLGHIAATSAIDAAVDLASMVSRHFAIVGSTGAGKSNLSAAILQAIATDQYPSARVLVIDPHGEYAGAAGDKARVFRVSDQVDNAQNYRNLYVPYWALSFDEFRRLSFGDMSQSAEAILRDEIVSRKIQASQQLDTTPPESVITADSPIPFSAKQLWFDLINHEKQTYTTSQKITPEDPTRQGDPENLIPNEYPLTAAANNRPFAPTPRGIQRQLELFRSRLTDSRYSFLFQPGESLSPSLDGDIKSDLGSLAHDWIGHSQPITILDVSGVPAEVVAAVIGTAVTLVYDTLFWAAGLDISGRNQPLLVMIDEAHTIIPQGTESIAHRALRRIAREGRKYGIGLGLITQRPTEIDQAALSQCGTMMALRLSNKADRNVVAAAMPDDLGNLAAMLPSLRTGEGVIVGEAMPIPSRVRFNKVEAKTEGTDPSIDKKWRLAFEEKAEQYDVAIDRWRQQSLNPTNEDQNHDH